MNIITTVWPSPPSYRRDQHEAKHLIVVITVILIFGLILIIYNAYLAYEEASNRDDGPCIFMPNLYRTEFRFILRYDCSLCLIIILCWQLLVSRETLQLQTDRRKRGIIAYFAAQTKSTSVRNMLR